MSSSRYASQWGAILWLVAPLAVATATFVFPPSALIPVAVLAALFIHQQPRGDIRGTGAGLAVAAVAVLGSNSAPPEVRVAAIVVAVVTLATVSLLGPRSRPSGWAVSALLVYCGYSALVSLATGSSSIATLSAALSAVIAFALVVRTFTSADLVAMVRWVVGIAVLQLAVAGAELSVLSEPIWGFRNVSTAGVPVLRYNPFFGDVVLRTQGTFGHPIPFSLFLIFTLFICLTPALRTHRLLKYTGVSVAVLGLLLSGTRSAAIAVILATVYYLISSRGITARARNSAVIAGVVALVLVADFGVRTVIINLLASDSLSHRVDGWNLAAGLMNRGFSTVLFGSGLNSEVATIQAGYLQQDGFAVIDNQWLTLLVTTGLTGTAIFLGALVLGWFQAGRAVRALIAAIAVMFFSFDVTTWPSCFTMLAIALAVPREATGVEPGRQLSTAIIMSERG